MSNYRTTCDITENREPQEQHEVVICEERKEWSLNLSKQECKKWWYTRREVVRYRKKREGEGRETEEGGGGGGVGKSEHLQEATPPIFANVEVKHLKSKQVVRREWI
jgi:hypothetical protein